MALTVTPVDGGFAGEVAGLDLWSDLDRAAVEAIREAWSTRGVLVFRRQVLTEDELVAFGARFEKPVPIVRADWASDVRAEPPPHKGTCPSPGGPGRTGPCARRPRRCPDARWAGPRRLSGWRCG